MTRIGVYTSGLWKLRREIALLTGASPRRRFFSARGVDAIVGWGFKPTAARARALAARRRLPYIAIEDGFVRSRSPGDAEPSLSYIVDRTGVYYDARGPSDFEAFVRRRAMDPAGAAAAAAAPRAAIREDGLSKYALFDAADRARFLRAFPDEDAVLVVDQVLGDAAVGGAGADQSVFDAMLAAAADENPHCRILVKTHPETQIGRRSGYLDAYALKSAAARSPALRGMNAAGRLAIVSGRVAPLDVLSRVARVYTVSSQLGFEALIAGKPVTCFGQSFYAGWGLTDDRGPPIARRRPASLDCVIAAAFRDYARYFTARSRAPCDFEAAAAALLGGEQGGSVLNRRQIL